MINITAWIFLAYNRNDGMRRNFRNIIFPLEAVIEITSKEYSIVCLKTPSIYIVTMYF